MLGIFTAVRFEQCVLNKGSLYLTHKKIDNYGNPGLNSQLLGQRVLMNIKLFTKIGRLAIVVALSAIAVTIGATTTTQVQPAYSQASHCGSDQITIACATPGKDASTCVGIVGGDCLS
jgi:hypothetical protein